MPPSQIFVRRHAELVSASMPRGPKQAEAIQIGTISEAWTLKQVQGDDQMADMLNKKGS